MFKPVHELAPDYLRRLFVPCPAVCNLRDRECKLVLPNPLTNYLKTNLKAVLVLAGPFRETAYLKS